MGLELLVQVSKDLRSSSPRFRIQHRTCLCLQGTGTGVVVINYLLSKHNHSFKKT